MRMLFFFFFDKGRIPWLWMPTEALRGRFTTMSDVWVIVPLQLESRNHNFSKTNMLWAIPKSICKIPKWRSVGPVTLKNKFIRQFQFFGRFIGHLWKMLLESKVLHSNNIFHTNLVSFFSKRNILWAIPKSICKIPKWRSVRPVTLKSKFIRQFQFLANL